MTIIYYTLDGSDNPVPTEDVLTWARWFEKGDRRRLAFDKLPGADVSTVFLGVDYNFSGIGKPVLWETLVFGGPLDGEQMRYSSKAEALAGHRAMVERVRRGK